MPLILRKDSKNSFDIFRSFPTTIFHKEKIVSVALIPGLISGSLVLPAFAQGITGNATGSNLNVSQQNRTDNLIAQQPPSTTILPTDVMPLPAATDRLSFAENLQLRVLQKLPAKFYFNATNETSFRYETNVFQFPNKRSLMKQLPRPSTIMQLNAFQQGQINDTINLASANDTVFRTLPNVTGGWAFNSKTRAFVNYFMIRDQLMHWIRLNTVIHSISLGIQRDIPITRRGNLQVEIQGRELYQLHQQPVYDWLPGATFSYILTPRTVVFVNALLQLRGKRPFQAPTREIDPFYTFGMLYQKGGWSFANTSTFVQNFREPFRRNASIPRNNYSWILDFEIGRRLIKQVPGLQAFIRAEPIYNFHSHQTPGLAGMDFRFFYGLRFVTGKPPLTAALEQIRQQLEEQEATPPTAPQEGEPKPSAFLMPQQVIAASPQPMHGTANLADDDSSEASIPMLSLANNSNPLESPVQTIGLSTNTNVSEQNPEESNKPQEQSSSESLPTETAMQPQQNLDFSNALKDEAMVSSESKSVTNAEPTVESLTQENTDNSSTAKTIEPVTTISAISDNINSNTSEEPKEVANVSTLEPGTFTAQDFSSSENNNLERIPFVASNIEVLPEVELKGLDPDLMELSILAPEEPIRDITSDLTIANGLLLANIPQAQKHPSNMLGLIPLPETIPMQNAKITSSKPKLADKSKPSKVKTNKTDKISKAVEDKVPSIELPKNKTEIASLPDKKSATENKPSLANASGMKMVVVPPLPKVEVNSKDNPIPDLNDSSPTMFVVH